MGYPVRIVNMRHFRDQVALGKPILTTELPVIHSADPKHTIAEANKLCGVVDAVNVGDNAAARAHISPLAIASILIRLDLDPVIHLNCRDRNRLALQADIAGAAMLGVHNILCLTGDDVTAGDQKTSKRVFDLDSIQLLSVAKTMSRGRYLSGKSIADMPTMFLGATENPSAPPLDHRAHRALKKFRQGAGFFQLQTVYDIDVLGEFLQSCIKNGTASRSIILPTVFVAATAKNLRYMQKQVPGISVPEKLIQDVERFRVEYQKTACLEQSLTLASEIIKLAGTGGLHVISFQGMSVLSEFRALLSRSDNQNVA